ncbi:MAG TPA: glycosyltransferase [Actinoplanes sp.]|nr:glycosyltransferase [Actinoplanes sp.]
MGVYDVAILSDLRYPGGNSASIVAEVQAQAGAGLSTVLIHVPSPHLKHARPFHARITACLRDGLAELACDGEEVRAKLLVIRQPRIFTEELATVPRVVADRTVLVINQPPGDAENPERYYVFAEIRDRVERYFGARVEWSPISAQVREQIRRVAPGVELPRADWHEIIDVDQWWTDRSGPAGAIPVIGRHGRPDPVKWPREPDEIRQAYPDTGDVRVRILGGGEIAVERLGRCPSTWDVLEFGAEQPADFLRTLDFFVYFHDPHLVEAFGRTILEAMASGVPVIVGEHFRDTFADAALYTDPSGVRDLVRALHQDRAQYRAIVHRAREFVERRFGNASHISRLRLRPSGPARTAALSPPAEARTPRVLLMGEQLDRLLAIARRLPAEAVLVTGSEVLPSAGLLVEHLPPITSAEFLRARLRHLIAVHTARAVVMDGLPHDGILAATADDPAVTWLWIRPAMWRRSTGVRWRGRSAAFDGVLEPGEFAAAGDEGWTATEPVDTVAPITYYDRGELLPRRESGGLPALLLRGVRAGIEGFQVIDLDAQALRRADLAVARADYPTFHELLSAGVPTVFVPDPDAVDDQLARARFAAAAGAALCYEAGTDMDDLLAHAARPDVRVALAQRCAEVAFENGAQEAADWITAKCGGPSRD